MSHLEDYNEEYLPDDLPDDETEGKQASVKGRKAKSVQWTEHTEMVLVALIYKLKAYKKTDETAQSKYEKVTTQFFQHAMCVSFTPVKYTSLQKKFERLLKSVSEKFSLETEGANLSGLPEDVPKVTRILYDMKVELLMTEQAKVAQTEKEKKRELSMLTHEASILEKFDDANSPPPKKLKLEPSPRSSPTPSEDNLASAVMASLQKSEDRLMAVEERKLAAEEKRHADEEKRRDDEEKRRANDEEKRRAHELMVLKLMASIAEKLG